MLGQLGYNFGLGANPEGEGLQQGMANAAQAYEAYRPEAWAARMGALQHTMDMFAPVNAKLVEMYGADAAIPLSAAFDYQRGTPPPSGVLPPMKIPKQQNKVDIPLVGGVLEKIPLVGDLLGDIF